MPCKTSEQSSWYMTRLMQMRFTIGALAVMGIFIAALTTAKVSNAQSEAALQKAMSDLKAAATKLGAPKIVGTTLVGDNSTPALYFGATKINNNSEFVDAVVKKNGGTATVFVRDSDDYITITSNVPRSDGRGRAIGIVVHPKDNKVIIAINKGDPYYGEVAIFSDIYNAAYEPIKNAAGQVIGIYYVGFKK